MARLGRGFYRQSTLALARALLGQVLVVRRGNRRRSGRIVETEAYVGSYDLASHSSRGKTARNAAMFGPPGTAYVYLIYGMHHCFNVVSGSEGVGAAVLVRAVEPLEGLPFGVRTDGPGRVCRALSIGRAQNCQSLLGNAVWIESAPPVSPRRIGRGPRVGVDYAGRWAEKPYRFWIRDHPHVSRPGNRKSRAR